MKKVVFAGSFDPFTNGHLWILKEALSIFNKVYVFVAENKSKKTLFTANERVEMIKNLVFTDTELEPYKNHIHISLINNEYVAEKALSLGCEYMIRGLRNTVDFEYEQNLSKTNYEILQGSKTIFIIPPENLKNVSSSFVKEFVGPKNWHLQVKKFLPENVYFAFLQRYIENETFKCLDLLQQSLPIIEQDNYRYNKKQILQFLNLFFQQYSQKNRSYHNLEHITHCFSELKLIENNLSETDYFKLFMAILGHDVIYGAKNNEKTDEVLSAEFLMTQAHNFFDFKQTQFSELFLDSSILIEATQHQIQNSNKTNLTDILISIDLAILGQNEAIYSNYCNNIRQEYSHIQLNDYQIGRSKALKTFIDKEKIFPSTLFQHYESKARVNLGKEILSLS